VASVCRAKGQLGVKAVPIGGPPWHERRNRSLSQSRVLFEVPFRSFVILAALPRQ
jgi:hypothetical protein